MKFAALTAAALALALAAPVLAAPAAYKAPRNAYGQPDLGGVWTNATMTPLQREAKYGDNLFITEAEAKALEKANADFAAEQNKPVPAETTVEQLPKDCGGGFSGVNCGYNNVWVDPGSNLMTIAGGPPRTSIIVEPKTGRIPPMTPAAQARLRQMMTRRGGSADHPEGRALGERCLMSFDSSAGPPMLPLLYNNTYQIIQTRDEVMILVEMVHDVRHIRLDGAPMPPKGLSYWMGSSTGRWEGDTLVIETTNIRPEQGAFRGVGPNGKVIERLTRVSPTQIKYSFTVEDPEVYTAPWTGELAMNATKGPIYEYACHEGNYALPGILAGARQEEKERAAAAAKPASGGSAP